MEIKSIRDIFTENSTTGKYFVDGEFECFVLEDVDRHLTQEDPLDHIESHKVFGSTAIPTGRYQITVSHSAHFNRDLPHINDVPGFAGILVHPGNKAADTEGCNLPGETRTTDFVGSSVIAFEKLFTKIKAAIANGEEVWITITAEY